jgi:hypothetical protein
MHDEKCFFRDVGITKISPLEDKMIAIAKSSGKIVLLRDDIFSKEEYLMATVRCDSDEFDKYVAEPVTFSLGPYPLKYKNLVHLLVEK